MTESGRDIRVASIVVTFNPILSEFCNVLRAHDKTGVDSLIIVDNGSANQKAAYEEAMRCISRMRLVWVAFPENVGLATALNEGIRHAELAGHTHVALFDQDSVVPDSLVRALSSEFSRLHDSGCQVAAIGPTYIDPRTNSEYPQCLLNGFRLTKVFPSSSPEGTIAVSFIITSGTFASVEAIRDIGYMRDDFFIDCIDVEWGIRAVHKGFSVYSTNKACMHHTIGDRRVRSLGREISIHSPLRRYYMTRNGIYLAKLTSIPVKLRIMQLLMPAIRIPVFLWAVRFSPKYIKYISVGLLHGLTGRLGRLEK